MTSASHHFATCCSSIVLPVPKPPGTAALLPRATGKQRVEDPLAGEQRLAGRDPARAPGAGRRTGQLRRRARPACRRPRRPAVRRRAVAGRRSHSTRPRTPGGTSTRYSTLPAPGTVPSTVARRRRRRPPRPPAARPTSSASVVGWSAPRLQPGRGAGQRPQQPVEDPAEQPGPSRADSGRPSGVDRVTHGQAAGVLVGLHRAASCRGSRPPRRAVRRCRARPARTSRGRPARRPPPAAR